jgi:hypothetical protein
MSISASEMGALSRVVSSTLILARNRKPYDKNRLKHAYKVLSVGRYLSDPLSYSADQDAMSDSALFLNMFDTSAHDAQVMLTQTWITIEMVLKGELVDPVPATRFFETVARKCLQQPESELVAA